jgi:WD40 repeat protein
MHWELPEEIGRLLFSPSGQFLATAKSYGDEEGDHVLRLWDAIRGLEAARLEGVGKVVSLAFVSERQLLAVVWERPVRRGEKDQALIWDADTGEVRLVWDRKSSSPTAGTVTPDGKTLVLVLGSEIVLLDWPSGTIRHRMFAPWNTGISYDDLAVAGPFLAASCREDRDDYAVAALWDIQRGKRLHTDQLETGQIFMDAVAVCASPPRLAFAFHNKIRSFGTDYEADLEGFKPFRYRELFAMRYSPGGEALEAICQGALVRLGAATGEVRARVKLPSRLKWDRAALDPSGAKVALADAQAIEVLDLLD